MWKRSWVAAAALFLVASASGPLAAAEAAKADVPETKEAREAREAKEAMERAQRLATNPMRVIMQAGKIRRKPADVEPAAEAADMANLRRTAARTAPLPLVESAAAAPHVDAAGAATRSLAGAVQPVAEAPAPAPTPAPPPKVMQAGAMATAVPDAVPALEPGLPMVSVTTAPLPKSSVAVMLAAPLPAPVAAAVAPAAVAATPAGQRPTLVNMVEPDIPVRLLGDTGRVSEVEADLTLRADGSVASVTLVSPLPRSWRSYITAALERWRFAPLAAGRVHRVQLVFNE